MSFLDKTSDFLLKVERKYYSFLKDWHSNKRLTKKVKRNVSGIFTIYSCSLLLSFLVLSLLIKYEHLLSGLIINPLARCLIAIAFAIILVFAISSILFRVNFNIFRRWVKSPEDLWCYNIALKRCNYTLSFIIGTLLSTIIGLTALVYDYINLYIEDNKRFVYKLAYSGGLYFMFCITTILKLIISHELNNIDHNSNTITTYTQNKGEQDE